MEVQPDVFPRSGKRKPRATRSSPPLFQRSSNLISSKQVRPGSFTLAAQGSGSAPNDRADPSMTGLAVCATCQGAMTLRTGTSKTGIVHRYYCPVRPARRRERQSAKGQSIRMDKLVLLILSH